MISRYIEFSKKPLNTLLQLIIFFFLIPFLTSFFLGNSLTEKFIYFIVSFLIIILLAEFTFLFIYKLFTGAHYQLLKKIEFEKLAYEPHPYLPFVYKKKLKRVDGTGQINYPLNKNIYTPELTTNDKGHYNGENGDRDILVPKPKNLKRINCLGGSTTGNYIKGSDKNYSYPLELERILKTKFNNNIEVNNCGQGGYNSADIFVRYALQSIDTCPDYIIIYHAYNDIRSYLTPDFSSDYFHSRKSLGEVYWRYYLGSKIPNLPINFINYLTNKFFLPLDVRSTILEAIKKGEIDTSLDYSEGLKIYERNLQHIIDLSICNNIKVILGTYCFYLYPEIKDDPLHKLYQEIVFKENEVIKNLAIKNNLPLVDADSAIKKDQTNFLDSIHLTTQGMSLLAKCVAEKINLK
jgi:lysophospholipase L1-like esterase